MKNLYKKFSDTFPTTHQAQLGEILLKLTAWEHLSAQGKLPEAYQTDRVHDEATWQAATVFLGGDFAGKDAFALGVPMQTLPFHSIRPIIAELLDKRKKGLPCQTDFSCFAAPHHPLIDSESGLDKLIHGILHEHGEIYLPFDANGQTTAVFAEQGCRVYAETPHSTPVFALMKLFGLPVEYAFADAVSAPHFVENGTLRRFECGFAVPPFGLKARREHYEFDQLDRFTFHRTFESLCVQHILKQTEKTAAVIVPVGFIINTFDKPFHEYLVRNKMLRAVVALPSGLFANTSVATVLLLLDPSQSSESVLFVQADNAHYAVGSHQKSRLLNVDALLELLRHPQNGPFSQMVSQAGLADKDFDLNVKSHVLDEQEKAAFVLLENSKQAALSELVEFIRPLPLSRSKETGAFKVHEVMVGDVPDFGTITTGRTLYLPEPSAQEKNKYLLKKDDIVVIIRGSAGKVGLLGEEAKDKTFVAGQTALALRLLPDAPISPIALLMQLRSEFGQTLLNHLVKGSTIPNLSLKDLGDCKVVLPTQAQQKRLEAHFQLQLSKQKQIDTLLAEQKSLSEMIF